MGIKHQIIFILGFLSVLALTNYYVYRRFFCFLSLWPRKICTSLIIAIMVGEIIFAVNFVAAFIPESPILYMLLSALVGVTFILFIVALSYDLIISASRKVPLSLERRQAIKIIFDSSVLVGSIAYTWSGFIQGLKQPAVNDVIVQIDNFPVNGFTIVQLSDLHIGHTIKADFLKEIVARTNAMHPDIVVITGDLVDVVAEKARKELAPLNDLNAPSFFVTGNHEYYHGVESILELVESLGVLPLANKAIQIGSGDKSFNLVGINDLTGTRFGIRAPDVETAYLNADTTKPTIVLSHQPKALPLLAQYRCDLMLSGHTHGGQIFPFGLLVMLDQPYLSGLYRHNAEQQIFVSRGTGYWGPPLRVFAPSEISRIVITKG